MTTTPYLITASGQHYRLTGPELDAPRIGDIAHHLAQINRFTGAASRPYSVAEHSLLCEHIAASEGAGPVARLCALMHDAHEAYTADFASPAKIALRVLESDDFKVDISYYDVFEEIHMRNVRKTFGLIFEFEKNATNVRRWDLIALATERRDLMPADDGDGWEILRGVEPIKPVGMLTTGLRECRNWKYWMDEFHERYLFLRSMIELPLRETLPL